MSKRHLLCVMFCTAFLLLYTICWRRGSTGVGPRRPTRHYLWVYSLVFHPLRRCSCSEEEAVLPPGDRPALASGVLMAQAASLGSSTVSYSTAWSTSATRTPPYGRKYCACAMNSTSPRPKVSHVFSHMVAIENRKFKMVVLVLRVRSRFLSVQWAIL